ncbi:alpha/beta fold hydrolase [Erythrobacter sp. THAF29]|uniref:alpha/beta fold hydrolase n=1 Tax=Erythrobacter sp. THAF29 TaxID=2587851 RepID=UPI001267C9FF|nr:alpha/beta hydrolase [Erythrobacter sp. THAF29]QFT76721.1 Non-heme chloroperoxidase [Erythrobacter sp. THAF29]
MTPFLRARSVNGIELAYFEWAGAPGNEEPPLIFAHATGFHARVWEAVIEHFPNRRVISIDLRGHGRSGGGPIEHWGVLVSDVCGLLRQLGISDAVGVGHSMGAHILLQCAADMPGVFSKLVLFDPVILAPEYYEDGTPLFTPDKPHPAARRKRDFDSPEAMIERFRDRDPYNLFDPRVFEDYCRHGLLPRANGEGYELACLPEMEASVYGSSRSNRGIHDAAKGVDIPVLVVRAKQLDFHDFKGSPTWSQLATILPQGEDLYRPDMTHFHPFQDPGDAARIIRDFIA